MFNIRGATLAAFLVFGVAAGLVIAGRLSLSELSQGNQTPSAAPPPAAASAQNLAALPDLSPIAERALQVAASISSTTVRVPADPIERMFYGAQSQQSSGSGVVVSADGYILTNSHVVGDNARAEVRVTLFDGREFDGRIVGIDDITDLAVIKIDARNLATLPWGDSTRLRIAEWVLAIGNPFQFSGTVTLGIVSTVSRSGEQVGAFSELIQTDAAINPGNSGGALVNSRGELVGINSMIYSETGGYQGIGFAIPSSTARQIMNELIANGKISWGSIGAMRLESIDRDTARYYRLGDSAGVYVRGLARGSSAEEAGIRPGDLIVAVNGQPTPDADQLGRLITKATVGSKAELDVRRGDRLLKIAVPIVSRNR